MLLTIDPAIRRDFELLGPYELIQQGHNVSARFLKIEGYLEELYKLGHPLSQEASINGLLVSLTEEYEPFVQIYREKDLHKTFMKMHSMLTLYESFMEMHSLGLSPAMRYIKNPSRRVLGCLKLGIHRVGYNHRIIGKRFKAK
ncbi:hypothetical protein L2E82_04424 [Cichorium intybus]|uniref:Uncharacterized protein n=1 Tax=Cichorium intybus TaxID=13427 RepID=A0ACB9H528_CICIN|nr:hypothetical protein L2E82_04424 [Cichorium intybus]